MIISKRIKELEERIFTLEKVCYKLINENKELHKMYVVITETIKIMNEMITDHINPSQEVDPDENQITFNLDEEGDK